MWQEENVQACVPVDYTDSEYSDKDTEWVFWYITM